MDFVLTERRKPILMVEAKLTAGALSPSVRYLKQRFPADRKEKPAFEVR